MNMREKIIAILRSKDMMLPYDAQAIAHADAIIAALREQEPFAWAKFDGEGSYELRLFEENATFREDFIACNGDKYAAWIQPLYALPIPPVEQAK